MSKPQFGFVVEYVKDVEAAKRFWRRYKIRTGLERTTLSFARPQ